MGVRKQDQLGILLERGLASTDSTMIGDRAVDVIAGRAHGLRTVGVLWGHGSKEEVLGVAPDRVLRSPRELVDLAPAV